MQLVQMFSKSGPIAQHPSAEVVVPKGYKLIGGGAIDNWVGEGNMLTASYPSGDRWIAAGKDHQLASPAYITAYALGLIDPDDEWEVLVAQQTSDPAQHPQAVATLPKGYVLTGGGAFVDYGSGYGNILTASFPNGDSGWEARSKDHLVADAAKVTAYAIGVRPRANNKRRLIHFIKSATGAIEAHPKAQTCLDREWTLSGGGALDNWNEPGNLLTASYPQDIPGVEPKCWVAAGKDHVDSSPASITVYAIGIRIE
jgi:vibriolysin